MRNLVLVRAGDSSVHESYTVGSRDFDVFVQYFGSVAGRFSDSATYYEHDSSNGPRNMAALAGVLARHPDLLEQYDNFWFPDDDIEVRAGDVEMMFAVHSSLGLGLSQPSLSHDSYFSFLALVHHPGFGVRFSNYVEVMAPAFSQDALRACLPTFSLSASGWGIDWTWQLLIGRQGLRSAILDCIQVKHTRPVGSGVMYSGLSEHPEQELSRVTASFGLPRTEAIIVDQALDAEFRPVPPRDIATLILRNLPSPTEQKPGPGEKHIVNTKAARSAGRQRLGRSSVSRKRFGSFPARIDAARHAALVRGMESVLLSSTSAVMHSPLAPSTLSDEISVSSETRGAAALDALLQGLPDTDVLQLLMADKFNFASMPAADSLAHRLREDLEGHTARGRLAVERVASVRQEGRSVTVGVSHLDDELVEVLRALEAVNWANVVITVPTHVEVDLWASDLEQLLTLQGHELGAGNVEVRATDHEMRTDGSLDFYMQDGPGGWSPRQPLKMDLTGLQHLVRIVEQHSLNQLIHINDRSTDARPERRPILLATRE